MKGFFGNELRLNNLQEINLELNIDIRFKSNSEERTFTNNKYKVHLLHHFLTYLPYNTSEILFTFTSTQDLTTSDCKAQPTDEENLVRCGNVDKKSSRKLKGVGGKDLKLFDESSDEELNKWENWRKNSSRKLKEDGEEKNKEHKKDSIKTRESSGEKNLVGGENVYKKSSRKLKGDGGKGVMLFYDSSDEEYVVRWEIFGKDNSRQFERAEEKNSNVDKKESIKTRGEIRLNENLKNAFLNGEYSDIILRVGDKEYSAHKFILSAQSSVFRAMLKHDMKEKTQGVINIEDCDPRIFQDFLLYLYSGRLDNITNENVFELYYISDKYDVKEFKMDCIEFIQNNLNVDIICDAISLATRHSERELLSKATVFFIENVKDILTTVNWQKFVQENPVEANELFIKTVNKDFPK